MAGQGARTGGGVTGQLAAALHNAVRALVDDSPGRLRPEVADPQVSGKPSGTMPGRILIGF
ncbi:MAG: hypothetical protein KDI31_18840, partial [Pseudomonadales bacterium]|nr:hypothetical protein [Pseudomonadales bacterium]